VADEAVLLRQLGRVVDRLAGILIAHQRHGSAACWTRWWEGDWSYGYELLILTSIQLAISTYFTPREEDHGCGEEREEGVQE